MPRRTATGMLEGYASAAREMVKIAHFRESGEEPLVDEEARVVEQVRRHAIGLEQSFERWAAIRVSKGQ